MTVTTDRPPRATPPDSPPPTGPPTAVAPSAVPPPPRGGIGRRLVIACLLVLLASAGAGAMFVLNEVHTLRDALESEPEPQGRVR